MTRGRLGTMLVLFMLTTGCEISPPTRPHVSHGNTVPSPYADMDSDELRDVLSDLAHAHDQKKGVALWVTLPVVGKTVGPAFQSFYATMDSRQSDLLKQIQAWAAVHKIDLTYSYTDDTDGRALKIMEDRQEKLLRADSQPDFERDMLMQMYSDYEWQVSQLQALLPKVKDVELKAYVQNSLQVHQEGSDEIIGLLRRFKFAG